MGWPSDLESISPKHTKKNLQYPQIGNSPKVNPQERKKTKRKGKKHDGMLIVYGINLSMHHLNRKIMAGVVKDLHQMA